VVVCPRGKGGGGAVERRKGSKEGKNEEEEEEESRLIWSLRMATYFTKCSLVLGFSTPSSSSSSSSSQPCTT